MSTGAPDSPVRTGHGTVHCLVPATSAVHGVCSSRPLDPTTGQSGALTVSDPVAVDHWPWAHRTVRCTPESPVNYSRGALNFSRERPVRRARQPGHRTLSGAPQVGASLTRLIFRVMAHRSIFLKDVYELYAPEKRSTRQTS
jgi:hypothetical protein